MPSWIRNAGKIMSSGDSITVGHHGLTGGWRKKFLNDLNALGVKFSTVGPYNTDSPGMSWPNHCGFSGQKAQDVTASFASTVSTHKPTVIIYGWGMNDLGNGRTPTQYLNDLDACIDGAQTNGFALHLVQTLILPQAGNPGYFANLANFVIAQAELPSRVSAQGGRLVNIGSPTLTDGVHPADGAGGYDLMATNILAGLLAAIP